MLIESPTAMVEIVVADLFRLSGWATSGQHRQPSFAELIVDAQCYSVRDRMIAPLI
jgi:hypothetical protein